ncbi:MAG: hypothetical protein ACSHWW_11520 [Nonlabens sp.]|uniref:hypothetical protein n=1 Tax=Nonlabens sp. TaxID=1888209 RepID=UPI003EF9F9AE
MNFKWYIVAFLSLISIFVVQQQDEVVPNQEIVLHFTSDSISAADAQYSITLLTKQLQEAGAVDINATLQESGSYRISYHSELNVAGLKERLNVAEFHSFLENHQPYNAPFEEDRSTYKMDVHDLQQDTSGFAGSDAALFFEIKQDFNRGSQVSYSFFTKTMVIIPQGSSIKNLKCFNQSRGLTIADRSYVIPAVRAGPFNS